MREGGNFRKPAEGKGEGRTVGDKGFGRRSLEREVEEDFINDKGEVVVEAEFVESAEFLALNVGTRGIVGMDEEDRAGARGDGMLQVVKIDEPPMGVFERVGDQLDVLEVGEKFE